MPKSGSYFRLTLFLLVIVAVAITIESSVVFAQNGTVAVVSNRFANIRSGPGTGYTRLGRVYQDQRLPVTDIRAEWVAVTYQGRDAWIFGKLVSLETAGPSQTEIDRVELKVEDLNNRLDRLAEKIDRASEIVAGTYPAPPPPDTATLVEVRPKRKKLAEVRVSPAWIFIPGGPRLAAGDRLRGYGLLGLTAACAGAGYYFHDQYLGFQEDYRALDPSAEAEEFRAMFDKADNHRRVSEAMIYAAAGMYALNVLDYFFFLPRAMSGLAVESPQPGSGRINLSMSTGF
jgi:hypothetical protein